MRLIRAFVVSGFMLKMRSNSARRSEGEQGAEIWARCVASKRQRQKEGGRERDY